MPNASSFMGYLAEPTVGQPRPALKTARGHGRVAAAHWRVLPTDLPGTILPYKDIFIWLSARGGGFSPLPPPIGKRPTMASSAHLPFDALHIALKAAGEGTRLRILALLAEAELTVSDLTEILRQS